MVLRLKVSRFHFCSRRGFWSLGGFQGFGGFEFGGVHRGLFFPRWKTRLSEIRGLAIVFLLYQSLRTWK